MDGERNQPPLPRASESGERNNEHNKIQTRKESTNLPEELILEILSRLPVKTLMKFRCVSKLWLSLISSRRFVKAHLEFSTRNADFTNHGITYTEYGDEFKQVSVSSLFSVNPIFASNIDFPIDGSFGSIFFVGSCNGIICLGKRVYDIFLWNPSTKKYKDVPSVDTQLIDHYFPIWGFCYSESEDDYKVLHTCKPLSLIWIYSLRDESWKKIEVLSWNGIPTKWRATFASGKFHVVSRSMEENSEIKILSLDLKTEACGIVEQPDYGEGCALRNLITVGGCLSITSTCPRLQVDVWVLKEYGVKESWTRLVSVPFSNDPVDDLINFDVSPMLIMPNVLLVIWGSLAIYNPKDNSTKYLKIIDLFELYQYEVYVESLVPL